MEYPGLDSMLLHPTGFPALDPVMITCPDDPASATYEALTVIRARLFQVGIYDYKQAIVAGRVVMSYLKNHLYKLDGIRFIASSYVPPDTIFVLTKKGAGRAFIHPPYLEDGSMMSWDEYFERVAKGETMRLMFDVPWAQARIDGVSIND